MAINYFGEARMKQLLTLIKGQLDLKATPEDIAKAIEDANLSQYALGTDLTAATERIGANESDIAAIKEALENVASSEGLASLVSDVAAIKADYLKGADKTELEEKITAAVKAHDDSDAAHAALFKALNDKDSAIEAKIGTVTEGKTVVEMIADAQTAATYDDTQVKADIKTNKDAIDTLNGSGDGSVDKKITDAFNDFATKVTDDGVVNSYKELIDWAAEHGGDAAEMAAAISKLEAIVDGIGGEGEKTTVVAYVTDAIEALKIGDYAKATELAALADRVTVLEGKSHEHGNKAVLDGITAEMVAAWNEADTEWTETEVQAMWDSVFTTQA